MIVTATPAAAHARLLGTDPAEDAVVATRPEAVRLTFDQPVRPIDGGTVLYAADRPPRTLPATADGNELRVALPGDLGPGTYLLGWRAGSQDSHPISGVLEFSIGHRGPPPAGPQADPAAVAEPFRIAAQAAAYLGLLLAIGLAVFDLIATTLLRRDGGPHRTGEARLRHRLEFGGGALGLAGWIGVAVITGRTGAPLVPALGSVLLAAAGLGLLAVAPDRSSRAGRLLVGAGAVVAAAAALPLGHGAAKGPVWLMLPADLLHILTGALWLGGLAGLVILLGSARLRSPAVSAALSYAKVLDRFSILAAAALVLLAATGVVQTLLILPEPRSLIDTGYGRVLLVKIGLTAVAAALAAGHHYRMLPRIREARTGTAALRRLRRGALNEAAILVLAVITAGVLVGLSPVPAAPRPPVRDFTVHLDLITVRGHIDPGRVGGNVVELTIVDRAGRQTRTVENPRLRAIHRASGLGPIDGTTSPAAAGSYRASLDLPLAGTWRFEISARTSTFAEPVAAVDVEIAP
ncbi:copper resistance CopC/CopD family protein [Microlunatus parietis]|uniref:Copper transport protein n=1 Tax=Microlunatus parietis TaxID=682979 RepID=A0A7Y9IEC7_9ACTN|nr:copper resistance protein CopC [Microlunatus parietis]NYE75051.1 copper transport protein [Microlunatus parietis]